MGIFSTERALRELSGGRIKKKRSAVLEHDGQEKERTLKKKSVKKAKLESDGRGIVYISRIPPHMKPHKLRQLLSEHGEIGRLYCTPESPHLRKIRKKRGGNTGKNFTEGWVEFEDKKDAKRVALLLNGQPMGGKHRSSYHYDLWCLKYLPKFKWDHLTEEIAYEKAVREQKLAAELSAAKRERDFYLSRIDKAKAQQAMAKRKERKAEVEAEAEAQGKDDPKHEVHGEEQNHQGQLRRMRMVGQRRPKADPTLDADAPLLSDDVLQLLGSKR